jgi:hypothetical protein
VLARIAHAAAEHARLRDQALARAIVSELAAALKRKR